MASARPVMEIVLAGVAGSTTLAVALVPETPWLAPEVQPLTLRLSAAWTAWRLLALDRTWRSAGPGSRRPGGWLDAAALPMETTARLVAGRYCGTGWCRRRPAPGRLPGPRLSLARRAYAGPRTRPGHRRRLARCRRTSRGGHPALHAVGEATEQPLVVPWSEMTGHVLITGTTRSGKTRLLEVLAAEVIRGPGAVVILDPKGDRELLARCAAEAQRQQPPFALLTPAFPAHSARMNVLDTATTPAEVATRIRALMPSGGARVSDPFFEEYPLALIERLATVQAALGQPWTLEGLYPVAVLRFHLEALLADYLHHLGYHAAGKHSAPSLANTARPAPPDLVADALIDDLEKPRDHFTKVTSNLIPAFRGVVGAPLGPLFSTIPADVTWRALSTTAWSCMWPWPPCSWGTLPTALAGSSCKTWWATWAPLCLWRCGHAATDHRAHR